MQLKVDSGRYLLIESYYMQKFQAELIGVLFLTLTVGLTSSPLAIGGTGERCSASRGLFMVVY